MVERFNGRIEEVLRSHHFTSGEDLDRTIARYVWLYNHQLPQAALKDKHPWPPCDSGTKTILTCFTNNHMIFRDLTLMQHFFGAGCAKAFGGGRLKAKT
jgi:hypothetical protein